MSEAPFIPSPAQLELIKTVNLAVNDDSRWIGQESFCVPAMAEKLQRLQAAGIPLAAMAPLTVDAGPTYGHQAHSVLQISGEIDGKPWVTILDVNQPWPMTPVQMAELGYTVLET